MVSLLRNGQSFRHVEDKSTQDTVQSVRTPMSKLADFKVKIDEETMSKLKVPINLRLMFSTLSWGEVTWVCAVSRKDEVGLAYFNKDLPPGMNRPKISYIMGGRWIRQ